LAALGSGGAALGNSQPGDDGPTRQVADFIVRTRYEDVPREAIELGRKSILDGLGLALVGAAGPSGQMARRYLETLGLQPGSATLLGSTSRLSPRFAAFANGTAIHADDYDDTQLAVAEDRVYGLLMHPTAPNLAAALAVAEAAGRSGRDLMLAYHVGVEVSCKIAEAMAPRHYQDGFHTTGTCGALGAAAAVLKLDGADRERCARALGIAASEAAGLRQNFGTMTKPLHAGRAAESGVVAADLARIGWTASDRILEAPNGFFHAAGGGFDAGAMKLGRPWTFLSPGVSIKPYPSGSLTHPAMTALLGLIREHAIRAEDVERVEVGTNRNMPSALIHHKPADELQAKFSMEFCMAALLLYGKAGLREFTTDVVRRAEVQSMIARVKFGVDAEAERAGYNKMTSIVTVGLKNGRTVTGRADFAKGSPADPMSYAEAAAKFEDCAAFVAWPKEKAKAIREAVGKLEEMRDVRALAGMCRK
jgi:2-methylcitrate dehydratase PrpD